MQDFELENYLTRVMEGLTAEAKVIHPGSVVTAPWVRLKCQFGCAEYGKWYCCPPDTPTPEQTRAVLDSYKRAVLFHVEAARKEGRNRLKFFNSLFAALIDLEGVFFKDGYYKAFVYLAGPCYHCKGCAKVKGEACKFAGKARPAMEACGIDVYQTARNNGFFIQPLREKGETQNTYCLMLVD